MKKSFAHVFDFYTTTIQKPVLLALSGGSDSIALSEIFLELGIPFQAAHINYNLRGNESIMDFQFVEDYCKSKKITLHVHHVEGALSGNIQHEAREIRYRFFKDVCERESLACVALAHHANDQKEQFFLKILRGSGLFGLAGMNAFDGWKWRPLLQIEKKQLLEFLDSKKITWREDSSNLNIDYARNFFRNKGLPIIEDHLPSFQSGLKNTLNRLELERSYLQLQIEADLNSLLEKKNGFFVLNQLQLQQHSHPVLILHWWLNKFGFNDEDIRSILQINSTGKRIESKLGHAIWFDRGYYYFIPQNALKQIETTEIVDATHSCKYWGNFIIKEDHNSGSLDLDFSKIKFPLKLRSVREGDKIDLGGAHGNKKLSDLFVQHKIPLFLKNNVGVLEDGNQEIITVIGLAVSKHAAVSASTSQYLVIPIQSPYLAAL